MPATKTAGDLTVQLTDFTVGNANSGSAITSVNGKQTRFHRPGAGEDREIIFKLDIHSPRGANESWGIHNADLRDATGNHVFRQDVIRWSGTEEYYFGPALWPDESAWRLTLNLKKYRGYDSEELLNFTNVPVPALGATYTIFRTNSIHNVPVVLKLEFTREPDMEPIVLRGRDSATHVVVELANRPKDFVVDFLQFNADTGWKPNEWSQRRTTNSATAYLYSIPANVHALSMTWTVQQSRRVEFLVKPPPVK